MNMMQAAVGLLKHKVIMKQLSNYYMPVYSDLWWKKVEDSCQFLPEDERKDFIDTFVATLLQF